MSTLLVSGSLVFSLLVVIPFSFGSSFEYDADSRGDLVSSSLGMVSAVPSGDRFLTKDQILYQAKQMQLSQHPTWHKLLFYQKSLLGPSTSLWDSKNFFLHPGGNHDPAAELVATIEGFFLNPSEDVSQDNHPLCRYPARYHWLAKKLKLKKAQLPVVMCQSLAKFKSSVDGMSLSIVFSSYFLNNPPSMFGHTLFRLHTPGVALDQFQVKDLAINFAALMNPGVDPLSYAFKGLFGGFDGGFQVMPYYVKIQEYNNHEARDLWQYQLDLTDEELAMFTYSLWEVGMARANYYFLTENCSYAMVMLLEVAKPELDLLSELHYSVIPIDIVRVIKQAGLINEVSYEPSSYNRFLERLGSVPDHNRHIVTNLLKARDASDLETSLEPLEVIEAAQIIDTVLEYIEYSERLAAAKQPDRYAMHHQTLLAHRAKLATSSPPLVKIPRNRPDMGHKTNMVSVGVKLQNTPQIALQWRPAMHDTLGSPSGYRRDMSLVVLDHQASYDPEWDKFYLDRLEFIGIKSTPLYAHSTPNLSWQTRAGIEQLGNTVIGQNHLAFEAEAGVGITLGTRSGKLKGSLLPLIKGGALVTGDNDTYAKVGYGAEVFYEAIKPLRFLAQYKRDYHLRDSIWETLGVLGVSHSLDTQQEVRLFARWKTGVSPVTGASFLQYF